MDCSTPGFPVLHYLPEFAQTHVHWVGDAIQPSHPLSCPSLPAFNFFHHQGVFPMSRLFTSGGQSIGASASVSVLPMSIQGWFPLGLTGLIPLPSKGLSRVFSGTTIWKLQFFSAQFFFMVQLSHPYMTTRKTIALTIQRTEWQPIPVFLPGKYHGQRSLVGYTPWHHRVRHDRVTNTFTLTI